MKTDWAPFEELFQTHSDEQIAAIAGKSPDAARLKRNRMVREGRVAIATDSLEVPAADGFVGLDLVYFDIESTALNGMMGRMLCISFCDAFGNVSTFRVDRFSRDNEIDDRSLAVTARNYLEARQMWVGWNSKLFDVPMLNARLMRWGERPLRKDILHTDLMYFARGQFMRIGSSKLDNVQKFFRSPHSKSALDWDTWALAGAGNAEALDRVVEHCEADVLVLRDVFSHLKQHITVVHR